MTRRRLLFLVTEDWYFWSHRLPLARAARDAGYEVLVATRVGRHGALIEREGFRLLPLSLDRSGVNPLGELASLAELTRLYRRERPDLAHHVALKPVLYGSVAAALARTPARVNALTGLGFVFIARGWRARAARAAVSLLYKLALRRSKVIFQNRDDLAAFTRAGLVREGDAALIRSSGVDLRAFAPSPEPEGEPLAVLASRMLWDKGVGEFVAAARRRKGEGLRARFALVGESDPHNPAAVPPSRLEQWRREGVVEWWGRREDMPAVFAACHVVCLPSYREGLPKVLVEAAACGRPLVATDVPGCREIVRHEENGLLVPARDERALAAALRRLLEDKALRERLGARGRAVAAAEFSQERVVEQTLRLYRELLGRKEAA